MNVDENKVRVRAFCDLMFNKGRPAEAVPGVGAPDRALAPCSAPSPCG